MNLVPSCVLCLYDKERVRAEAISDADAREAYLEEVRELLRFERLESPPEYIERFIGRFEGAYGGSTELSETKRHFNEMMLVCAPDLERRVEDAPDPLFAALQLAQTGNYIDSVTMPEVREDELAELLGSFEEREVDRDIYVQLKADLAAAREVAYLTDNCGEVVADLLLLRQIRRSYPDAHIQVIVRGAEIVNDASMVDAEQIGLTREFDVTGNGTDILGTSLHLMPEGKRRLVEGADVIIAKGQGNFETLHGSGLNIYYLFLCKCPYFCFRFSAEPLSAVMCRETIECARDEVEEGLR